MSDKEQFVLLSRKLVLGLLREAIGYSVEFEIPYLQGTVGYMVEAPLLWIRHSRFPIIFVAYDQHRSDTLETVVKQLEIAKATEFLSARRCTNHGQDGTGDSRTSPPCGRLRLSP